MTFQLIWFEAQEVLTSINCLYFQKELCESQAFIFGIIYVI